jgi:hypothetical protein
MQGPSRLERVDVNADANPGHDSQGIREFAPRGVHSHRGRIPGAPPGLGKRAHADAAGTDSCDSKCVVALAEHK